MLRLETVSTGIVWEGILAAGNSPTELGHHVNQWLGIGGFAILFAAMLTMAILHWMGLLKTPIPELGPTFFFWLGNAYLALLLLIAAVYLLATSQEMLLAGTLPVAVPWFGALGAVTISLEGVFQRNKNWDSRFNYWHLARPLFGAVLAVVAFFLFVLIIKASGRTPEFFAKDAASGAGQADFIVYYVVAFLVGYREETFRELIKRATDVIMGPGSAAAPAGPVVEFVSGGNTLTSLDFGHVAVGAAPTILAVQILNTGGAAVQAPQVILAVTPPAPAGTFQLQNDNVTGGGDLPPGAFRTVDVVFQSAAAGTFRGEFKVVGNNIVPRSLALAAQSP